MVGMAVAIVICIMYQNAETCTKYATYEIVIVSVVCIIFNWGGYYSGPALFPTELARIFTSYTWYTIN